MKPKKAIAPSDSQRDSQDNCRHGIGILESCDDCGRIAGSMPKPDNQNNVLYEIELIRKKAYAEGFQEAVKLIKKEVKKIHIWKNCSDDFNAELSPMIRVSEIKDILRSLKLTPDQGSEGEGK